MSLKTKEISQNVTPRDKKKNNISPQRKAVAKQQEGNISANVTNNINEYGIIERRSKNYSA